MSCRCEVVGRLVTMMTHPLSESPLFLLCLLLLDDLLKEGKAEAVNVRGARLGHGGEQVSLLESGRGGKKERRKEREGV